MERREGLPALRFRLENAPDPDQVVVVADAVLAWTARYPGYSAARAAFVELLGTVMAPLGPEVRVPEDLLEMRNMLAIRAEQWKQEWQLGGRREGEAALLLRLLERRFGLLPAWARDRVLAAETVSLEEWGLRILDGGRLEDVLGVGDRSA